MCLNNETSTIEQELIGHAKQTHLPIHGSIELLPLCNMNCDMCYVRLSKEEMEQQGRLHTANEWIEIGKQMVQNGVLFLLLTGGEPLLFPEFKQLYLELRQMGLILTINTNGTLIDEEWARFFGKYKPRRINITLYGTEDNTYESLCHYPGGYRKVIQAIDLLKEAGVDVKIGGSLTTANLKDLNQLLKLEEDLGIPVRIDTYMMPATRERRKLFNQQSRLLPTQAAHARIHALRKEMGESLFKEYAYQTIYKVEHPIHFEQVPRGMDCLAGNCSFSINWQGQLHPCVILTEPSSSVFEVGFKNAWKYVQNKASKIRLHSSCTSCEMRPLCRTCAACALLEGGSYDAIPEYMCQYTEASLRLLRKYIKEQEGDIIVNYE